MFIRPSKFRHVFGCPFKKEACYEGLKATKSAHDTNFCAVNPLFLAVVVESSGGGSFVVVPVEKTGRVDANTPKVCGHRAPITDLKWCPHNDYIIASSSDDATIKVWSIPDGGLFHSLTEPVVDLANGHYKRVSYIEWHPCAQDVLLSAGADYKCVVWDIRDGVILKEISIHPDMVFSISWNMDGSLFATMCKDKLIRIIDPRSGKVVAQGAGHQGNKASKVVFLHGTQVFTTGFSRTSERQYALWDYTNLSKPTRMEELDSSCGSIFPFFDPDLNILYLAGKGDGNIRYVEIINQPPYIYTLNQFQSSIPQRGLGTMPKRGLDMKRCEIARFYKLHSSKDICEPISMIVPRKSDNFQPDIYPPTLSTRPSITAEEWMSGVNRPPVLIQIQSETLVHGGYPMRNQVINYPDSQQINNDHGAQHLRGSNISRSKSLQHGLPSIGRTDTISISNTPHGQFGSTSSYNLTNTESLKKSRPLRRRRRSRHDYDDDDDLDDTTKDQRSSPSSCHDDDNDSRNSELIPNVRPRNTCDNGNLCHSLKRSNQVSSFNTSFPSGYSFERAPAQTGMPLKHTSKTSEPVRDVRRRAEFETDTTAQTVILVKSEFNAPEHDDDDDDDDDNKHASRAMLDCISVDAPDDGLIVPSKLRASMNSRHSRIVRGNGSNTSFAGTHDRQPNLEFQGLIRAGSVREKSRNYNKSILNKDFYSKKCSETSDASVHKEAGSRSSIESNFDAKTTPNGEFNNFIYDNKDDTTSCNSHVDSSVPFKTYTRFPAERTASTPTNSNVSSSKPTRTPRVLPTPNDTSSRKFPWKSIHEPSSGASGPSKASSRYLQNGTKTCTENRSTVNERKLSLTDKKSIDGHLDDVKHNNNNNNSNNCNNIQVVSMNDCNNKTSPMKQSVSLSHTELLQEYSKQQQEIKALKVLLDQRDARIRKMEEELNKHRNRKIC